MRFLILGHGKMGSLVAEVCRERGHTVEIMDVDVNAGGAGLTEASVAGVDVAIDFTTPEAVLTNVERCAKLKKNIVVGTTGWYGEIAKVRELVERSGIGFVYGANFSVGANLFYEIARTASTALKLGYAGSILERHHIHKKDAPSGTAIALQRVIDEKSAEELPISSEREGEVVGLHAVTFESDNDTIRLVHDAKSRSGFAEGAVRAAEWIKGKQGFYDFRDIWQKLS